MSQACVLCPHYAHLSQRSHHVRGVVVGRGAQHHGHLGTFSTEDCEVMAGVERGLPYRETHKQTQSIFLAMFTSISRLARYNCTPVHRKGQLWD